MTLVDGYIELLNRLSPSDKLDLISKLSVSVKTDLAERKTTFKEAFGAFESEKSAEEIINDIRSSRLLNRQLESL